MRFNQPWGTALCYAAQRASLQTVAYRSRTQPNAEEASAILAPLWYQYRNGHSTYPREHAKVIINYVRQDDEIQIYDIPNVNIGIHIRVCSSRTLAINTAGVLTRLTDTYEPVGVFADYNLANVFNRIYKNGSQYTIITDTYTATNLARLMCEVYKDLEYAQEYINAVRTANYDVVCAYLDGQRDTLRAAEEAERAEEQRRVQEELEERRRREHEERMQNPFKGLENVLKRTVAYPKEDINALERDIETYLEKIQSARNRIRRLQIDYYLNNTNNQSSELTAMIDAVKSDKDIMYFDENKSALHVHNFLQSWDEEQVQTLYNANNDNYFSGAEWYRALIKEIFIDRTTKVLFKGNYSISVHGDMRYTDGAQLVGNPHHMHYNCFGEYNSLMQNAWNTCDYMQWYGLFKACVSTVNVLDAPVMKRFKEDLILTDTIPYLFTDGEFITSAEWRRRYEANELHIQRGAEGPDTPAADDNDAERTEDGNVSELNADTEPAEEENDLLF